jgi:hypothetical protein
MNVTYIGKGLAKGDQLLWNRDTNSLTLVSDNNSVRTFAIDALVHAGMLAPKRGYVKSAPPHADIEHVTYSGHRHGMRTAGHATSRDAEDALGVLVAESDAKKRRLRDAVNSTPLSVAEVCDIVDEMPDLNIRSTHLMMVDDAKDPWNDDLQRGSDLANAIVKKLEELIDTLRTDRRNSSKPQFYLDTFRYRIGEASAQKEHPVPASPPDTTEKLRAAEAELRALEHSA